MQARGAHARCVRRVVGPVPGQLDALTPDLEGVPITPAIASGATACAIASAGKVARFAGVLSSCGATAFTRIPVRAELDIEDACRYLPTNLSRPEIASDLSVSLNTVNTHVRSIYAKLRDRSSAVRRARELRLLSAGPTR
jgi:Bacterial regulatory proteins, luxR family